MTRFDRNIRNTVQGVAFLLYPILGLIADACITQYKMIKMSFVLVLICSLLFLIEAVVFILKPEVNAQRSLTSMFTVITIIIGTTGFGMYEANAIQFGMDQMIEASSQKLSSFIHSYYWSVYLGPLVMFYILLALLFYMQQQCVIDLDIDYDNFKMFGWMISLPSIIGIILTIFGLYIMKKLRKHVFINPVSINHIKNIFNILKYTWKHKYPVNRSAFTFWENDIPSRIDMGKIKYGGPFTNEQVEDVKTLLQLLLLIMSLFGFQLSGDGYSLSQYMMYNFGCPTLWTMLLLVMNPEHVTLLVILIGIPVYQFIIRKYFTKYTPNLLKKVHIGLFICLIREGIYPIISLLTASTENISQCYVNELYYFEMDNTSITTLCLLANTKTVVNGTCETVCPSVPPHNNLFLLLIIPQILHGIAYLLVFMTVLEFICAQAPYTTKELLIGIWYSTLSIKYLLVNIMDGFMVEETIWNIYHGLKGFGIFISIVCFFFVCKFYRYRERDEIVNEQAIIEEIYERELVHESDREEDTDNEDDEFTQLLNYS